MKKPRVDELRGAWEALADDPVVLAKTLLDLVAHADSDIVRVRAARAVLDRVGLRRGVDVGLSATTLGDIRPARTDRRAVDVVIERLAALRASNVQASHASHMKEAAL